MYRIGFKFEIDNMEYVILQSSYKHYNKSGEGPFYGVHSSDGEYEWFTSDELDIKLNKNAT